MRERFATLKASSAPAAGRRLRLHRPARPRSTARRCRAARPPACPTRSAPATLMEGLDEALVGAVRRRRRATFTTELVGGEYAGADADVTVTVRSVKDEGAARAGRRVRPDRERVRHPGRAARRRPRAGCQRVKDARAGRAGPRQGARAPARGRRGAAAGERWSRGEIEWRKHAIDHQLESAGLDLDTYLVLRGQDRGGVRRRAQRGNAEDAVKTQLILDAIADARRSSASTDDELTERRSCAQAQRSTGCARSSSPSSCRRAATCRPSSPTCAGPRRWPRCWSRRTSPTPRAAPSTWSTCGCPGRRRARRGRRGRRRASRPPSSEAPAADRGRIAPRRSGPIGVLTPGALRRQRTPRPDWARTASVTRALGSSQHVQHTRQESRERHRTPRSRSAPCPTCGRAGAGMTLDDSVYDRLLRERIIFLGQPGRRRRSPTRSAPSCCCCPPRTPSATSTSTSTRPAARSPPAWPSTTRCSSSTATSPPSRMGLAASMGQFLLSAGTPGKRYALPHARIMMHQPSAGIGGTASDIAIQAEQFRCTKRELTELHRLAHRPDRRADRDGLRPRPLVHRRGGQGVRLHRPGDRAGAGDPGPVGHGAGVTTDEKRIQETP